MSQPDDYGHAQISAPATQTIEKTQYVAASNIVGTFDVWCSPTDEEDCKICCTGCVAPYCLFGSVVKMRTSKFTKKEGSCDGGGGPCCGIFVLNCLCGSVGWIGPCITGCVAMNCMNIYANENENCFTRFFSMVFCFPCQSCADFKSAQKQVEENRKSNQQRGSAEPYQGVQQERQKKTDAQNEYLQNFRSNLKKKTKNKYAE